MRMSCPGQSTNDTCLRVNYKCKRHRPRDIDCLDRPDQSHARTTSWSFARRLFFLVRAVRFVASWSWARGIIAFIYLSQIISVHRQRSYSFRFTLALAYPSLMVIFRTSSFLNRTVCTPEIALTTVLCRFDSSSSPLCTQFTYLSVSHVTNGAIDRVNESCWMVFLCKDGGLPEIDGGLPSTYQQSLI